MLGQLLDRVAPIFEDAFVAVDVRDAAAAGGRIHERRVVGHQAGVVRPGLDLAQVRGAKYAVLKGYFVLLARAVVGNRERVGHKRISSRRCQIRFVVRTLCQSRCRERAGNRRPRGSARRPTVPSPRFDTARCRTAASGRLPGPCGTGRTVASRPSHLF